jgi:hypothetical protein
VARALARAFACANPQRSRRPVRALAFGVVREVRAKPINGFVTVERREHVLEVMSSPARAINADSGANGNFVTHGVERPAAGRSERLRES